MGPATVTSAVTSSLLIHRRRLSPKWPLPRSKTPTLCALILACRAVRELFICPDSGLSWEVQMCK
jgi:hypothetical protein